MLDFEIITVGDELLTGLVVDTNGAWLGREALASGARARSRQVVSDDVAEIARALREAAGRVRLCVVSGGLGPTVDDRTAEAAALLAGEPVVLHAAALELIERHRRRAGRLASALDEKQARLPASATALENPVGTAPAFTLEHGGCRYFFFPGVPRELEALCRLHLFPVLAGAARVAGEALPATATWKLFGRTEAEVAMTVTSVVEAMGSPAIELHYLPTFPEIHLLAQAGDAATLAALDAELVPRLGRWCYWASVRAGGEAADPTFPEVVNAALRRRGWTLATAESCTGGLIAQMVTSVTGSSDVFGFGAVTYSNAAKQAILGVPAELLAGHGAVSEPVVRAMADGVRSRSGATLGVAVSGVAGPDGGTHEKPVGTVHVALSSAQEVQHRALRFPFDRERNRVVAAYAALEMVRRACTSKDALSGDTGARGAGASHTERTPRGEHPQAGDPNGE